MAADRKFGKYKPEEEMAASGIKVEQNDALKKIFQAFRNFIDEARKLDDTFCNNEIDGSIDVTMYETAPPIVKNLECSSDDVEAFCILLDHFVDSEKSPSIACSMQSYAGYFMSAMINCGNEERYRIRTGHLGFELSWLGFRNKKFVDIEGDAGQFLGYEMQGGRITVSGSARSIGFEMSGGAIHINGEAIGWMGAKMTGGEIRLQERDDNIEPTKGGRIYIRGRLVADGNTGYTPPSSG